MALAGLIEIVASDGNAIIVRGELDEAGRAALREADPEIESTKSHAVRTTNATAFRRT